MSQDLFTPASPIDNQICCVLLESGECLIITSFSNSCEILIDLIFRRRGSSNDFFFKFFKVKLADKLNLGLKADVKILIDQCSRKLFFYLVIDVFVILVSEFIIMRKGILEDLGAPLAESFYHFPFAFFFELIASTINQGNCLILELIASERSNHDSLIWQVQLLLSADLLPSVTHKEAESIHWNILAIFRLWEQSIGSFGI